MVAIETLRKTMFTAILIAVISLPTAAFLVHKTAAQTMHVVAISSFSFIPQNLTIQAGDTILWNNTDPVIHTLWFVYVTNGSTYLLSDPIGPGATWNYTFNSAVELQYYDFNRLWITGFINVTAGVHDVAVTDVSVSKTMVGQGYNFQTNVTVMNQGNFTENFNVTVQAKEYFTYKLEDAIVTSLAPGANTTIIFTWNTTGMAKGNYTIFANATILPGETDKADNTFTDGWILITIPGDVDGDKDVDIFDIVAMAGAYGSKKGDPAYNTNYDIDGDGDIDIFDIVAAALNYGKSW